MVNLSQCIFMKISRRYLGTMCLTILKSGIYKLLQEEKIHYLNLKCWLSKEMIHQELIEEDTHFQFGIMDGYLDLNLSEIASVSIEIIQQCYKQTQKATIQSLQKHLKQLKLSNLEKLMIMFFQKVQTDTTSMSATQGLILESKWKCMEEIQIYT